MLIEGQRRVGDAWVSELYDDLVPLHSLEAEMSTLGSMILKNEAARDLSRLLDERDFYRPAHKVIFSAMAGLVSRQTPIDLVTLKNELARRENLYDVGGEDYLIQIAEYVPSAANATHYAQIVIDKSTARRIEHAARDILGMVREANDESADDKLARAQALITNACRRMSDGWTGHPFELYDDEMLANLPDMEWLIKNFIPRKGLGMIYGPPGNGKTFVVLDLCCAVAKGNFLFAKEFGIEGPFRVCYCAGEKFHGIPARKAAAQAKWCLTPEEANRFKVCRGVPQLFDRAHPGAAARFIDYMRPKYPSGLELLVIDTLHLATLGANEINGQDVAIELEAVKEIQEALGCSAVPVHHSGAANQRERGHTGWKASVDLMIKVEKVDGSKDRLVVTVEKISEADDNFDLACTIVAVEGHRSRAIEWQGRGTPVAKDLKTDVLRILRDSAGVGLTKTEVFDRLLIEGGKVAAVYQTLNRMAEQGKAISGVEKTALNPSANAKERPGTTKNPYLFRYDSGWIEQKEHRAYKDSDDAEEIIPPPTEQDAPPAEEEYDPFADE